MMLHFLPAIIALGFLTSITDIKKGKISNIDVTFASLIGIALNIYLITTNNVAYGFIEWLIYICLAVTISITIWLSGYWSAGDSKLFIAFVTLIPLSIYKNTASIIESLDFLSNIMIPIFLVVLTTTLFRTSTLQKLDVLKKATNPKNILNTLLLIFSVSWLLNILLSYFGVRQDYFIYITTLILVYKIMHFVFEEQETALLILISLVRIFTNYKHIMSMSFLINFLVITTGFVIVMSFIVIIGEQLHRKVNIHSLKRGMIPLEFITKKGFKTNLFKPQNFELLINPKKQGLSDEDILLLRNKHILGKIHFNELTIVQTIPFAPEIFLGSIFTIISQGNLIIFLKSII